VSRLAAVQRVAAIVRIFGDVARAVAIGTVFVHLCARTAVLARHSMALMDRMAAWAIGALTRMPAGPISAETELYFTQFW